MKVHSTNTIYEKYGETFFNVSKIQIDFTMGGLRMKFDNLFNGIKLLGESMSLQYIDHENGDRKISFTFRG